MSNASLDFFANQFDRQVAAEDFSLNPFESWALPQLRGSELLDLGCGLGNLAVEAACRGFRVTAVDGCPVAADSLRRRARARQLNIEVVEADIGEWQADRRYDVVVSIGLLMFFDPATADRVLDQMCRAVRPGGRLVLNVLVAGTTYMAMFEPGQFCLFEPPALAQRIGWPIVDQRVDDFPAPGSTIKRFVSYVMERPPGAD